MGIMLYACEYSVFPAQSIKDAVFSEFLPLCQIIDSCGYLNSF